MRHDDGDSNAQGIIDKLDEMLPHVNAFGTSKDAPSHVSDNGFVFPRKRFRKGSMLVSNNDEELDWVVRSIFAIDSTINCSKSRAAVAARAARRGGSRLFICCTREWLSFRFIDESHFHLPLSLKAGSAQRGYTRSWLGPPCRPC